jgi:hypothetical protein
VSFTFAQTQSEDWRLQFVRQASEQQFEADKAEADAEREKAHTNATQDYQTALADSEYQIAMNAAEKLHRVRVDLFERENMQRPPRDNFGMPIAPRYNEADAKDARLWLVTLEIPRHAPEQKPAVTREVLFQTRDAVLEILTRAYTRNPVAFRAIFGDE